MALKYIQGTTLQIAFKTIDELEGKLIKIESIINEYEAGMRFDEYDSADVFNSMEHIRQIILGEELR